MKFVLASKNKHKLEEMRAILTPLCAELLSPDELNVFEMPEETGSTFEENALIKAEALFKATGISSIADDSGLEVDFLDGEPGVHSARYCEGTDRDRVNKLLYELRDVPYGKRNARFVSAIACVLVNGKRFMLRGECEGEILREERGKGGFGYDPVFFVPDEGMTFSEMSAEVKNRISHRAKALALFAEEIRKMNREV